MEKHFGSVLPWPFWVTHLKNFAFAFNARCPWEQRELLTRLDDQFRAKSLATGSSMGRGGGGGASSKGQRHGEDLSSLTLQELRLQTGAAHLARLQGIRTLEVAAALAVALALLVVVGGPSSSSPGPSRPQPKPCNRRRANKRTYPPLQLQLTSHWRNAVQQAEAAICRFHIPCGKPIKCAVFKMPVGWL